MARGLRILAAGLTLHGFLLWFLGGVAPALFPKFFENGAPPVIERGFFWLLALPALFLAATFRWFLWKFGLMHASGWFAWPSPSGFLLVYSTWVVVLLLAAWALERRSSRRSQAAAERSDRP